MEDAVVSIRKNAELVVERLTPLSGIEFGLNRQSVEWVAGFIERQRAQDDCDANDLDGLIGTLGSFLGECIISAAGGRWDWSEEFGQWGVRFDAKQAAYPFAKVRKQFENGLDGGDSILGFYDVIVKHLATGRLSNAIRNDE